MRRKQPTPSADSEALHTAISQIIRDHGRGGLTFVAREIGMSASALRKRMQHASTAFDAPTLRGAILVMELRRSRSDGTPEPTVDTPAPSL